LLLLIVTQSEQQKATGMLVITIYSKIINYFPR
jgi:hypothetical protein